MQFFSVLLGMLGSTLPVSLIGTRFAMSVKPVWTPDKYSMSLSGCKQSSGLIQYTVPIVGMLCGSTISGVVVAVGYVLKELQ